MENYEKRYFKCMNCGGLPCFVNISCVISNTNSMDNYRPQQCVDSEDDESNWIEVTKEEFIKSA